VRSLSAALYILVATSIAHAEDALLQLTDQPAESTTADTPATPAFEVGLYSGGFNSNYYHQLYDY
jgi:hypothetical protein